MNERIDSILDECRFRENPYFRAIKSGDFELDDFVETQVQFFHAVVFFSRPMAALAGKIPTPRLRAEILRNVWEEHGEGDPSRSHGITFQEFLLRLANVNDADIDRRALWPEVRQFNTALAGACVLDEYLVGAAMMGIIERMFCEISGWIGTGVVTRGWMSRDRMIHYDLHEDLDVKHAQDFFDVLRPSWEKNAEDRYFIEQGFRLGAASFDALYEGLYRNRRRRLVREIRGTHIRA